MLNKELLIIAIIVILGLFAVILLQNHEQIIGPDGNGFYDQTSQENAYKNNNNTASS